MTDKALLVLDLDETLLHASKRELEVEFSFYSEPYFVYVRPHFQEFKKRILAVYRVAIWTAGTETYAKTISNSLFEHEELEFVWSRNRCTRQFDEYAHEHYWLKDLKKCKNKGYNLNRTLMVDNTPRKLRRNYGNLIAVDSFYGDSDDRELLHLAAYLEGIANHENYRSLEKRRWRIE